MDVDKFSYVFWHPERHSVVVRATTLAIVGFLIGLVSLVLLMSQIQPADPGRVAWEAQLPDAADVEARARHEVVRYLLDTPFYPRLPDSERVVRFTHWHMLGTAAVFRGWPALVDAQSVPVTSAARRIPDVYEPLIENLVAASIASYGAFVDGERRRLFGIGPWRDHFLMVGTLGLLLGLALLAAAVRDRRRAMALYPRKLTLDRHWATLAGTRFPLDRPELLHSRLEQLRDDGFETAHLDVLLAALDARTRAMAGEDDPEARARLQQLLASNPVRG